MTRHITGRAAMAAAAFLAAAVAVGDQLDFVDTLLGTGSKREDEGNAGGMMPYTGAPFGMWQWVPMTRLSEHGITSYSPYDAKFRGLLATRQPSPWMGEFGQLSVMAQTGTKPDCDYETRGVDILKDNCVFTPYYAKITTADGIVSEVASSSRAAILRFTFPKGTRRRLIFDTSRFFMGCFSIDVPQPGGIKFSVGAGRRTAEAWNSDRADSLETPRPTNFKARFAIGFSEPFVSCGTYAGDGRHGKRPRPGRKIPWCDYPRNIQTSDSAEVEADQCGGWCEFAEGDAPILVRIGSSFVDQASAEANLEREAGSGFDFDALKERSRAAWAKQLGVMEIEADDDVKKIFYAAMFHALLFPRETGEYGKYYSGIDDRVHDGDSYTSYSLWDTYRAEHAFLTLAAPERVDAMMQSLVQMYEQGGWLPKWPSLTYTGQMMASPAEMVLAEAYAKGFRGFDAEKAWEACWKSATVPQKNDLANHWKGRVPWRGYPCARCGLTRYMSHGWVAADECFESVTRTQDFGLNDLATASLGEALGHREEAAYLRKRSGNYRNVWHPGKKCFWPRHENGRWKPACNLDSGHGDYTECTPETSVWNVPYDLPGLEKLMGGRDKVVAGLDDYFGRIFFNAAGGTMSFHENEPTHHISYLYGMLGEHDKCARTVRKIMDTAYTTDLWGFEGNDDCGQMSAWYILSSLGFYPVLPYTGEYQIGSPLVKKAVLHIGAPFESATFTIVAHNQSRDHRLVESVMLNGVELADRHLRHSDILAGGVLEFTMR